MFTRPIEIDGEEAPGPIVAHAPERSRNTVMLTKDEFKKVNNLRTRANSTIREQGINTLFVAIGVLDWSEPDSSEILKAPVVLIPVALEPISAFEIRLRRNDDDIEVNPTLVYRLGSHDLRIALPPLTDEDDDYSRYLNRVRTEVKNRTGWKVADDLILGRFSFQKMAMYKDLERHFETACEHPIIAALAGNESALARLPSVAVPSTATYDDATAHTEPFAILDCDPSQQRAIFAARNGQSFVLQGPPGTGKSQTIANIIAECIAGGKRVLFVSQKMAALEAVFKRLSTKGLQDLCLEAHSHKAAKAEILEQLARSFRNVGRTYAAPNLATAKLQNARAGLAATAAALGELRPPLGISIYDCNGRIAALEAAPDLPFTFLAPDTVKPEDLDNLYDIAGRMARFHHFFSQELTHPWRGIKANRASLDLQTRIRTLLSDMDHLVDLVIEQAPTLAKAVGMPLPATLSYVRQLIRVAALVARTPNPPVAWFNNSELSTLRQTASLCKSRYAAYHAARHRLLGDWAEAILEIPHADFVQRLTRPDDTTLTDALGAGWAAAALREGDGLVQLLTRTADSLKRLHASQAALAASADLPYVGTLTLCRQLLQVAGIAASDIRPQPAWLDPAERPSLAKRVREWETQSAKFVELQSQLYSRYSERFLLNDLAAACERFNRPGYRCYCWCTPAYHRDREAARSALVAGATLRGCNLSADYRLAKSVSELAQWFRDSEAEHESALGQHYDAELTNWASVRSSLELAGNVIAGCPEHVVPQALAARMVQSGAAIQSIKSLNDQTELHLRTVDNLIAELGASVGLANFPFTSLPLSEISMSGDETTNLAAWFAHVSTMLADFLTAYATLHSLRRDTNGGKLTVPEVLAAINEAATLLGDHSLLESERDALRNAYRGFYTDDTTDWNAVIAGLDWVEELTKEFSGDVPPDLINIAFTAAVPARPDAAVHPVERSAATSAARPVPP